MSAKFSNKRKVVWFAVLIVDAWKVGKLMTQFGVNKGFAGGPVTVDDIVYKHLKHIQSVSKYINIYHLLLLYHCFISLILHKAPLSHLTPKVCV